MTVFTLSEAIEEFLKLWKRNALIHGSGVHVSNLETFLEKDKKIKHHALLQCIRQELELLLKQYIDQHQHGLIQTGSTSLDSLISHFTQSEPYLSFITRISEEIERMSALETVNPTQFKDNISEISSSISFGTDVLLRQQNDLEEVSKLMEISQGNNTEDKLLTLRKLNELSDHWTIYKDVFKIILQDANTDIVSETLKVLNSYLKNISAPMAADIYITVSFLTLTNRSSSESLIKKVKFLSCFLLRLPSIWTKIPEGCLLNVFEEVGNLFMYELDDNVMGMDLMAAVDPSMEWLKRISNVYPLSRHLGEAFNKYRVLEFLFGEKDQKAIEIFDIRSALLYQFICLALPSNGLRAKLWNERPLADDLIATCKIVRQVLRREDDLMALGRSFVPLNKTMLQQSLKNCPIQNVESIVNYFHSMIEDTDTEPYFITFFLGTFLYSKDFIRILHQSDTLLDQCFHIYLKFWCPDYLPELIKLLKCDNASETQINKAISLLDNLPESYRLKYWKAFLKIPAIHRLINHGSFKFEVEKNKDSLEHPLVLRDICLHPNSLSHLLPHYYHLLEQRDWTVSNWCFLSYLHLICIQEQDAFFLKKFLWRWIYWLPDPQNGCISENEHMEALHVISHWIMDLDTLVWMKEEFPILSRLLDLQSQLLNSEGLTIISESSLLRNRICLNLLLMGGSLEIKWPVSIEDESAQLFYKLPVPTQYFKKPKYVLKIESPISSSLSEKKTQFLQLLRQKTDFKDIQSLLMSQLSTLMDSIPNESHSLSQHDKQCIQFFSEHVQKCCDHVALPKLKNDLEKLHSFGANKYRHQWMLSVAYVATGFSIEWALKCLSFLSNDEYVKWTVFQRAYNRLKTSTSLSKPQIYQIMDLIWSQGLLNMCDLKDSIILLTCLSLFGYDGMIRAIHSFIQLLPSCETQLWEQLNPFQYTSQWRIRLSDELREIV